MNLSELQLGDWVHVEGKKDPVQITSLACDGSIEVNNEYYCTIEDLSPVELTDEIVEKRFERVECRYELPFGENGVGLVQLGHWEYQTNWCCFVNAFPHEMRMTVTYIHELQHIFRLFGLKKEVVL